MNLLRTARFLKELGIKAKPLRVTQLALLFEIAAKGKSGLSITSYAHSEGLTKPAISRKVGEFITMFEKPLIEYITDPTDRRIKSVILTKEGESFVNSFYEAFSSAKKENEGK